MNRATRCALLFAVLVLAVAEARTGAVDGRSASPETIYGDDDRLDLYQVQDRRLLDLADSTVALFEGSNVRLDSASDRAGLATRSYGGSMGLCQEEPFYDQKTGAFCSGSLVGPDLVMTAGHCVTSDADCKDLKLVFGFGIRSPGQFPDSVPAGEVYGCAQLLGREQVGSGADWALLRLDRKVQNHKPLAINRDGRIQNGAPLVVIGHPAGLPTKIAGGATVRDASPEGYLVANLDTYGGNSGSAVLNAATGLVEGILVRGDQDYVYRSQGSCYVSNRCPADGCRGEDVTKISALASRIPADRETELFALGPQPRGSAGLMKLAKPGPALGSLLKAAGTLPEIPSPESSTVR